MIGSGDPLGREAAEVKLQIARGHSKSAVDLAKGIHKRFNDDASESLLVDAYLARVQSMHEHGMGSEAGALLSLIKDRYPGSGAKLQTFATAQTLRSGSIEDLVRPLCDAGLPGQQRKDFEAALRRRLTDPVALANCSALPPDHPLRVGAAALCRAFAAVTGGPVSDERIALPEIPHRSVLAPWKTLVRALACFYRADDKSCERHLKALDPESPPARLAPVLRAMIAGQPDPPLKPAALALITKVGGDMEALRKSLQEADVAFEHGKKRKILEAVRSAVQASRRTAADLVERLKQHLEIRIQKFDVDFARADAALGGPCRRSAFYWLLLARVTEKPMDDLALSACTLWEEFRKHAVHEGWFPETGPEVAALYLHMVDLLGQLPRGELDFIREEFLSGDHGLEAFYHNQPDSVRAAIGADQPADHYYLYPEFLYARACGSDPDARTFALWVEWAKAEVNEKAADRVAEAWRRALVRDPRPLLHLMESAERRGALKKALGYLEKAEELDAINPVVRRSRFRLLVARVTSHLLRRKPHLAEKDLSALSSLPQARENERPALLAALRCVSRTIAGDKREASVQLAEACRLTNSQGTAYFLVAAVADAHNVSYTDIVIPERIPLGPDECLAKIVARVCAAGDDIGMSFAVAEKWVQPIIDELPKMAGKLSPAEIRVLAETALRAGQPELAYAASAAGLARGGASEARFLLLRARALPFTEFGRRGDCLAAAAELARRQGDADLAGEAVEFGRHESLPFGFLDDLDSLESPGLSITAERLMAVLKRERTARSYTPAAPLASPFDDFYDDFVAEDELDDDFVPVFGEPERTAEKPPTPSGSRKNRRKKQASTGPRQESLF